MDSYQPRSSTTVDPASPGPDVADLRTRRADAELAEAVDVFLAQRPQLVRIAYRVLGSPEDAEDVVQEAWIRWQRTDRDVVERPAAFLATATTRLAINVLHSARARHETAASRWLDGVVDPAASSETTAERTEAVEQALHLLLETLPPGERAAYILRKCFDYPYPRVAAMLHLSTVNARQLVSRAQRRIQSSPCPRAGRGSHRRLVRAFITAARAGELGDLEGLLSTATGRSAA